MKIEEKILDRIKKCLALSASSEPHEAAAALRQAQKLMEAHGVSQTDLNRFEVGEGKVKSMFSVSKMKPYESRLINKICQAFGCRLLWQKSRSDLVDVYGTYQMIGMKAQLEICVYTITVMQRKLYKARTNYVKSISHLNRQRITIEADGFCMGWTDAVTKTIVEFAMTDESKKIIDDEVARISTGKTSQAQKRSLGQAGYATGTLEGGRESIHRPMGETKHKFLK